MLTAIFGLLVVWFVLWVISAVVQTKIIGLVFSVEDDPDKKKE